MATSPPTLQKALVLNVHVLIGYGAVSLGFAGAVLGILTCGVSLYRKQPSLMRSVYLYIGLIAIAAVVGVVVMESALLQHDFSVKYVAEHGRIGTPVAFTIATLWGACLLYTSPSPRDS